MTVPFIDLGRGVREIRDEVLADWASCLDETAFVGGARVAALERELADALGARDVVACSNGSDAIILALQVLGVGAGQRVATSNLTFFATYEAIAQLGAEAVLIDVDAADLHLDLDELAEAHDAEPIDAVVLPQLFGWCAARTAELRAFCRERGIALVEDSAQAFGVELDGRSIFAEAPLATLSFYPAKVLGAAGDAGAICCADPAWAERLRVLRNHGRAAHYRFSEVGWNSRMSAPNAAFLRRMLARREVILDARRAALAHYAARFADAPRVHLSRGPERARGNGYLAVVTVDGLDGDALAEGLRERGIGCARTYPETIADQAPARDAARVSDLSRSRAFCERVVNLPLFYGITEEELDESADALLAMVT